MENRFIRLTTERFGKNSSRFENMLMTTRRTPTIGGFGAAAKLHVINSVGTAAARASFFYRAFSTVSRSRTHRAAPTVMLTRFDAMRRRLPIATNSVPVAEAVSTHRLLKSRAVTRAKAQQLSLGFQAGAGSLDLRLSRAKSPRSAAYVERETSRNTSRMPLPGNLLKQGSTRSLAAVVRTRRATASPQSYFGAEGHNVSNCRRAEQLSRRAPGLLEAQRDTKRETLSTSS